MNYLWFFLSILVGGSVILIVAYFVLKKVLSDWEDL